MQLLLTATSQRLTKTNCPTHASGSKGYITVKFVFSSDWDGLTKTAVFTQNGLLQPIIVLLDVNDSCAMPTEIDKEIYNIGVFGVSGTTKVIDTVWIEMQQSVGCYTTDGVPPEPTDDIYQQIMAAVEDEEYQVWEEYDDTHAYLPKNKVSSLGCSYQNRVACTGVAPVFNQTTDNWLLIAGKGGMGDTGASSYQAAVAAGYTDTEEEFNAAAARMPEHETKINDITRRHKNIQNAVRRPLVTFVADDGHIEDYTKLKPLSETYSVPFVSALVSVDIRMTTAQLLELQNTYGWEFASHTHDHYELATLTEAEIDYQCQHSKEVLQALGLNVQNIVYPQGSMNAAVRRIANKYYNCGVSASSALNAGFVSSFAIRRYPLGSFYPEGNNTYDYYKSLVDAAAAGSAWLVFMLHPWHEDHDETQQAILEQLIQYIQSINVDIVTLQDGFEVFGNAVEAGDYDGTTATSPLLIKKDGVSNIPNNLQIIAKTGITNETPITSFPTGVVSMTSFSLTDNAGFPTGAGTLLTSRVAASDALNFQLWFHYNSSAMYRRRWTGSAWAAFEKYATDADVTTALGVANVRYNSTTNAYSAAQLITDYPANSITVFKYNGTGAAGFPNSTGGWVKVYRLGGNGYDRMEVYTWNSHKIYSRYVIYNTGEWSPFICQTVLNGTTAARPADNIVGEQYFDTDIGKPIWTKTAGVKEKDTLTLSAGATASGNITITLNGVDFVIAVAEGDTIAQIDAKIRATTFTGWTLSGIAGSGVIVFTKSVTGACSAPAFADTNTTGAAGAFARTTSGVTTVWVDGTGATV